MKLLAGLILMAAGLPAMAADCAGLAKMKLAHTRITTAEVFAGGTFTPDGGKPIDGLPSFCRVAATIDPSGDSAILVEVWLPVSGWNERMEGTGNGGFAGKISYGALAGGVKGGYAVANTDMGMAVPGGKDAGVFVGHPERWKDWGYRSTHEMTLFAKAVVEGFYGRGEKKDYFVGCSTGGEQALMEAQRYPADYDGIVGGAPAHDRTKLHEDILWNFVAVEKAPGAYLPPAKVTLLADAVVKACDALDGVKDGVIGDPRRCGFDPGVLECKAGDGGDCLTAAQVAAVRMVYAGPKDARTGEAIYPGLMRGSEFGWNGLGPNPAADRPATAPYAALFEWVFGADWDWRRFDFGRDADTVETKLAGVLNATDPNLNEFRKLGHKLLLYHGWADPLVAPGETIRYFDQVRARDGGGKGTGRLDESVRLFMLPGVAHCSGGSGPSSVDTLGAMVKWVEGGAAPERLIASKANAGETVRRPLCPYPAEARYDGVGDVNDPAAYACVAGK